MGISVGDTIFQSELPDRLASIPGYTPSLSSGIADYTSIQRIQPDSLRQQVSHAFTRSLATIYMVMTPISFVGLLFGALHFICIAGLGSNALLFLSASLTRIFAKTDSRACSEAREAARICRCFPVTSKHEQGKRGISQGRALTALSEGFMQHRSLR